MKKILLGLVALSAVVFADISNGGNLYKKCSGCHGSSAEKKALGQSLIVADMNSTEIINALEGYKNNTYGRKMAGIMIGQTVKLTTQDIEDLSAHITSINK